MTFAHLPSEIGAVEAEEIGVEHLLRDVKDSTVSDLATSVQARMDALKALKSRLKEIYNYLDLVCKKKLPVISIFQKFILTTNHRLIIIFSIFFKMFLI